MVYGKIIKEKALYQEKFTKESNVYKDVAKNLIKEVAKT